MLSWEGKSTKLVFDDVHNAMRVLYDLPLGGLPPTSYTVMPNDRISVGYKVDHLAVAGVDFEDGTPILRSVDCSHLVTSRVDASYNFFGVCKPLTKQMELDLS